MAHKVTLIRAGDGEWSAQSRSYEEIYRVDADSGTTESFDILNASGIPTAFAVYPKDSGASLQAKQAKRIDKEGTQWEVTCKYQWTPSQPSGTSGLGKAVYQYAGEEKEQVAWSGYEVTTSGIGSGVPILNSCYDPFKPPPMTSITILLITAKKRTNISKASTVKGFILSYMNTINSGVMSLHGNSYPVGTLLCRSIKPNDTREYLEVEFVFAYKQDTWALQILDAGTRANFRDDVYTGIPTISGVDQGFYSVREVRMCDVQSGITYLSKHDRPVKTPVMLDGSGHLLGCQYPYNPSGTPVFLPFWVGRFADWSSMSGYLV